MFQLNCRGKILDLSHPQVMGILNITPNSFSVVGRFLTADAALKHAEQIVQEGAALIDVGGEPTNPGVHPIVSLQEELDRVMPVIEALVRNIPVPISIDTSKPAVMRAAIAQGVGMINDVRALQNPECLKIVAAARIPVCLMHMAFPQGWSADGVPTAAPGATQPAWLPPNVDMVDHIKNYLATRVDLCIKAGIEPQQIIIDPGVGGGNFGKSLSQNLQILARLAAFQTLGFPLLVGVSRKLFVSELLGVPIEERLYGSLAAGVMAVAHGANIIRAHDVRAMVEAVKMTTAIGKLL
jgi:dihydropteroate synthase